jgi:hypothetical protein
MDNSYRAFDEIVRQVPTAVDCSKGLEFTEVLVFDVINLRKVVTLVLEAKLT